MHRRDRVLWVGLAIVLIAANLIIFQKEQIREEGRTVFLTLAPVDPRSMIQGDYMTLNYALWNEISARGETLLFAPVSHVVIRLDQNNVGHFARLPLPDDSINDDEILLHFWIEQREYYTFGAESFFFQEGHADYYADARYAELRVDDDGNAVLVGLRDVNLQPLGPPGE